jgi:hypothetical protein
MVQICSRCSKANPEPAVFCWFDGAVLRQEAALQAAALPQEFVFPSGRRCRTFDELVQGCQYEWEDAREMLRDGQLTQFLARIGRHDLAHAAAETQAVVDPDIALYRFLGLLPASAQGPRLDLHPRRISIGPVRPGEQKSAVLTVSKQGTGLLQGRVTVTEGTDWLRIVGGTSDSAFALKTGKAQQVNLLIDTRGLFGPRTFSGKLTVVTNGGIAEVPIRLEVGSMPFPRGAFQGAASPRDLAEKMRANPKAAVGVLESGEVARWFRANGWAYPVSGEPARGVAAVQQFFEGMGLSKPPPLKIGEEEMRFLCVPPEVATGNIMLQTPAKKWVYAQAESDRPWLKVLTPAVSGPQQAAVAFEIDTSLMDPDQIHLGTVQLTANAGQRFAVKVHVDVRRPHQPFTRRLLRPFLVGAILALAARLLLVAPADLFAWRVAGGGWWVPGSAASTQPPSAAFLRPFVLASWWLGILLAVFLVWRRGGRGTDLFCACVAGAFAGLLGAATLGCGLLVLDALPHALLARLTSEHTGTSSWSLLPVWVLMTSVFWALVGGAAGCLLAVIGRSGAALLAGAASAVSWLFRRCGLERAATFFVIEG